MGRGQPHEVQYGMNVLQALHFCRVCYRLFAYNEGCHVLLIVSKCPYTHGNREHTSYVSEPRSCCQSRWEFQHQKGFTFCLVDR